MSRSACSRPFLPNPMPAVPDKPEADRVAVPIVTLAPSNRSDAEVLRLSTKDRDTVVQSSAPTGDIAMSRVARP